MCLLIFKEIHKINLKKAARSRLNGQLLFIQKKIYLCKYKIIQIMG